MKMKRYAMTITGRRIPLSEIEKGMSFRLFEADGEEVIVEDCMVSGYFVAAGDAYQETLESVRDGLWTVNVEVFKGE